MFGCNEIECTCKKWVIFINLLMWQEKFIEQFYNLLCIQITKTHEMVNLWSLDNISLKFIELNFGVLIPLEINTIIPTISLLQLYTSIGNMYCLLSWKFDNSKIFKHCTKTIYYCIGYSTIRLWFFVFYWSMIFVVINWHWKQWSLLTDDIQFLFQLNYSLCIIRLSLS